MARKQRKGKKPNASKAKGGFVLLYRKLRNNPRYRQSGFVQVWIHFLLSARFQPGRELFDGKLVTLAPGQFISSRREICESTGLSGGMVKRLISDLQSDQQIDQLAGRKHSMFTVRNWQEYQGGDPVVDPPVDQQLIHDRSMTDPSLIHESQNPQAGVQKNDPNNETRNTRNNVPKSNSGGTGDSVKGGTTVPVGGVDGKRLWEEGARELLGVSAQDASSVLVVPEFEPLPEGAFQRELEQMLKVAKRERARVESSEAACVWREVERDGFADDVEWYENALRNDGLPVERRAKLEREFAALKAGRLVRVRGPLTAQAVEVIGAWSRRIEELEKAIAGVKR
jgi:hypothetical protein